MTKIEWTDEVWNPVTGCTKISEGCQHCYAERMAKRLKGRFGYPEDDPFRVTFHPDKLDQPLKWKKPRMVFVSSMGDLFHEDVPFHQIDVILGQIVKVPQHTFLILTKRPTRMSFHLSDQMLPGRITPDHLHQIQWPLPNLWLGVTAENQQRADERIPILLQIPAAKKFVSVEPMLGPLKLSLRYHSHGIQGHRKLDWVIAGCESGPGRRPAKVQWFRDLKNQCVEAGVPYFLKQMEINFSYKMPNGVTRSQDRIVKMPMLDGRIWDQMP